MPAAAPLDTRIFPLSQVRRGQKGVAYTVFEGVTPEPMQVEILGVLKDSLGPGRDLILARLRGAKPEYTGVVAGMSGSPVYIDGQLAGAISYRIGQFSKDPIAGITPIESMLEVRDAPQEEAPAQSANSNAPATHPTEGQPAMQAMETPLVFGGFSPDTVERFGDRFRAMGLTPVAGLGGANPDAVQPEPLVPGSAVSAILVRGDLSMAGTCTVTYIDPKRLLACGHPISQYGPVDMPMTKAEVVTTLASPLNAFKIINTTQTVGAFTEDRAAAILGRIGTSARMIPVSVEIIPPGSDHGPKEPRTFHFEVLDNRQLTPSAMLVSVYQTLQSTNASTAEMSYRLSGDISVKGYPPVRLEGIMAQNSFTSGAINAALYINERFSEIYGNTLQQPVITGLRLRMETMPERKTAVLDSSRLSTAEARAGETIEVEATLHPFQAAERIEHIKVKLPDMLMPGPLRIVVSDGATVDRLMSETGAQHSAGLADSVAELNRSHANDRIYVTLLGHTAQAVIEGEVLPNVPVSMVNVLEPLKTLQKMQLTAESVMEAGSAQTDFAVAGSQVLSLQVR